MSGSFGLGAALGSWGGGVIYDWQGSYQPAFQAALAATIIASVGVLLARRLQQRAVYTTL
jgi:predicted MFS family arabinose efflux permease